MGKARFPMTRGEKSILAGVVGVLFLYVAGIGLAIWVVVHFVLKYW